VNLVRKNSSFVVPAVIRDLFVEASDALIRTPQDLAKLNTNIQKAIERADKADSAWLNDLLDMKQRINSNFARRFKG
jgi:hypothetical protein